jgi:tRNA (5-methylaminomethyl-2-thiouridylate)-methyltransferase
MKIAVLLSGGVDSSVALNLLDQEGHDCTAFYLKIWLEDELSTLGECPWEDDLRYARGVCNQANIPLKVLSLQKEYWDMIVTYAIRELKAGRTPNSDMFCNRLVKFGVFYDKIDKSYQKIASGHYARIEVLNSTHILKKSPDPIKDQTYFLAYMQQEQLARACFPLGLYTKSDVRQMAESFNLPNKNRKDSQGICFLGQIRYTDFVKFHLGEKPGDFINIKTQQIVGTHLGYWFYTIGQRQGLGLSGGPWYVVKKDIENNRIYLSRDIEERNRLNRVFSVCEFNWISGSPPSKNHLQVKIRHGEHINHCTLSFTAKNTAQVVLDEPDQGLAPGQFAVFYDGDICLGGGIIQNSGKP